MPHWAPVNSEMEIVADSNVNASTWGDARPQDGYRVTPAGTLPKQAAIEGAGLADAGKALSAEIGAARADLERLDALLADAVATLVGSFGAVRALCGGQGEFTLPLARAATALQFQDLASQLIAHTRGRMDEMTRIGEELDRLGASLAAGKTPAAALAEACARLAACVQDMLANNLRQPVRQREIADGSIELFQGD
jgi:hypothetical protein